MASERQAIIALRRFGLGARPDEIKGIASDPRGYLLAQLDRPGSVTIDSPDLDPSHETLAAVQSARRQKKLAETMTREASLEAAQETVARDARTPNADQRQARKADRPLMAQEESGPVRSPQRQQPGARPARIRTEAFVDEATHRFRHQASTDAGFAERLVMFWSNHFCVMARGPVRGIAGAYEREAIRPHVFGSFAGMLKAVEQHPAMLIYLDNQLSFGPNSPAGLRQKKGLNENLAREILELHTLGVDGGYTQADVTNLARIITGWTVAGLDNRMQMPGQFLYAPQRHEPGDWTVLGKTYRNEGQATGARALDDLARHPSTARHVARKMVRHFVADAAPQSLVDRLERRFRETEGDLCEMARTLVTADEAWAGEARKLVPPLDLVVQVVRSLGLKTAAGEMLRLANQLGQPLWQPPSPKGWPDDDNYWASASALGERLRIAEQVARSLDKSVDPRALADSLFGPALHQETRRAIARAENREQGLELLVMSADFQRR